MKHILKIQIAIVIIILLIATSKSFGLAPVPEPNDIPFPYDPNLLTSPVFEWLVCEPADTYAITIEYVSLAGVDVNLVASEPNITIQFIEKRKREDKHWGQVFELLWTPFDGGVHYIELTVRMRHNDKFMDARTLLWCVEQGFIYPFDHPIVTSQVGWAQQVVQRAVKLGRYPPVGDTGGIVNKRVMRWK